MIKFLFSLLICSLIISCQQQSTESSLGMGKLKNEDYALAMDEEIENEPPRTAEPPSPDDFYLDKGSKIIKKGYMTFEVKNLETSKQIIDSLLHTCKGYYEKEQYHSYGNRITYSLLLRVPNLNFDPLVNHMEKGIGELKTKNLTATDISEEYLDLNIRLENNLSYLKQYREILSKAKSVKDILEVQERIRNIEEEIESKKGRIKYLDDQVSYSSLNLEISELIKSEISDKQNFGRKLVNAFTTGVEGFLDFLISIVSIWPLLLLFIILFLSRKSIFKYLVSNKSASGNTE